MKAKMPRTPTRKWCAPAALAALAKKMYSFNKCKTRIIWIHRSTVPFEHVSSARIEHLSIWWKSAHWADLGIQLNLTCHFSGDSCLGDHLYGLQLASLKKIGQSIPTQRVSKTFLSWGFLHVPWSILLGHQGVVRSSDSHGTDRCSPGSWRSQPHPHHIPGANVASKSQCIKRWRTWPRRLWELQLGTELQLGNFNGENKPLGAGQRLLTNGYGNLQACPNIIYISGTAIPSRAVTNQNQWRWMSTYFLLWIYWDVESTNVYCRYNVLLVNIVGYGYNYSHVSWLYYRH